MDDDATRWDQRYRNSEPTTARPPDVVAAHPELLDLMPRRGRGLDVACGTGAQSLWMAELGLDVTALDVSPVAVDLTRSSAAAAGVADRIDARVVDLDDGLPADATELALVVCQRFRHRDLYEAMVDVLRPEGIAVVSVLSEVGASDPGPFHAAPGELIAAYRRRDLDVVYADEAAGLASVVIRRR